jgi:cytochrome c-type biogenesis protein CcmH/NrfF
MPILRLTLPTVFVIILLCLFKKGLSLEKGYTMPLKTEILSETSITPQVKTLNEKQMIQYQLLIQKLRCVVCYNQNLAESQAPMAMDIKQRLQEKIAMGQSESDIIAFMIQNYGDFILYDPPYHLGTALLWGGPLLLLTMAIWILKRTFFQGNQ